MMNLRRDDRGFTLVELMVVVLVIAILIAIAIPTFLGARERSQDRAAQTLLRNGMTAVQVMLNDNDRVVPASAVILAQLPGIEPSINWVDHVVDAQASATAVSIDDEPTFVTAATASSSGACFYVRMYVDGTDDRHRDMGSPCTAHAGESTAVPSGW